MLLALLLACSAFSDSAPADPPPEHVAPELPSPPDGSARRRASPKPFKSGRLELIKVKGRQIGKDRSAYVKVPKGKGPFPVILAFHGGKNNDGRHMVARLAGAEDRGILLAYPNASFALKGKGWVGPDKPDEPYEPFRDVRYTEALIDTLDEKYGIDRDRVYAVGMSGGGYMTDLLWCTSDRFAGFGVVARAMPKVMSRKCHPAKPTPYVLVLGTADEGVTTEEQLSFEKTKAFIHDTLNCKDPPSLHRVIPAQKDNMPVDHTRWACAKGSTFDYFEVHGGGHRWPGSREKPASDRCMDLDATAEMLRAFHLDE